MNRVLIVRLSALGDCVHVLPALDALRRGLPPKAHIAWLIEEKAAALIQGHPQLDRVHVLPRGAFGKLLGARKPLAGLSLLGGFLAGLRKERYDATLDFQSNLRSSFASLAIGAPLRYGFGRGHCREKSYIFRNRNVLPPPRLNKVAKDLELVRALGVDTAGARAIVPVTATARAHAAPFFAAIEPPGTPVVALHPGVSLRGLGQGKSWPPALYGEVADRLARSGRARCVVTWGPGEHPLAEAVAAAAKTPVALAPETSSILELAALFERCAAVVGCDTGPIHLAAALGVPVVGLYGPKEPAIYGPWGARPDQPIVVIWKEPVPAITVDEVEAGIRKAIEDVRRPGAATSSPPC